MILSFSEEQRLLRQGRASLAFITRLPRLEEGSDAIEGCYTQAAKALETWAKTVLLSELQRELAEAPRRNRLHSTLPRLSLCCEGSVTADRWISISLTILLEHGGGVQRQRDCRVWDGITGKLCPLEFFLSRREAKAFSRWSFVLEGESVLALSGKKRGKDTACLLEMVGKMKNIPAPY